MTRLFFSLTNILGSNPALNV